MQRKEVLTFVVVGAASALISWIIAGAIFNSP